MYNSDIKSVYNFIKTKGVCTTNDVWKEFSVGESEQERNIIIRDIMILNQKGLVEYDYSQKGLSIIKCNFINVH